MKVVPVELATLLVNHVQDAKCRALFILRFSSVSKDKMKIDRRRGLVSVVAHWVKLFTLPQKCFCTSCGHGLWA